MGHAVLTTTGSGVQQASGMRQCGLGSRCVRTLASPQQSWLLPQWKGASIAQPALGQQQQRHRRQQQARCIFAKARKGLAELLSLEM